MSHSQAFRTYYTAHAYLAQDKPLEAHALMAAAQKRAAEALAVLRQLPAPPPGDAAAGSSRKAALAELQQLALDAVAYK